MSVTEAADNKRNFRKLVLSVEASYDRLSLLMALADNWKYRDELIEQYETELKKKGTRCYRVKVDQENYSLKQRLLELAQQEDLSSQNAVVTVLGADELLAVRLRQDEKSSQEKLFFSLQWTRESLRQFQVPVVLWLTPQVAGKLAKASPDFWSWRGGVFEFSKPIVTTLGNPISYGDSNITQVFMSNLRSHGDLKIIQGFQKLRKSVGDRELGESEKASADTKANPRAIARQIVDLNAQEPDSPLLASLYMDLGAAYKAAVRYPEAEMAYKEALTLRETQLGAEHVDTATSLNNLAELYRFMGSYPEAEPLYARSLEIYEAQLGSDHPNTATSLNNLALLYRSMGRYSGADPLLVRSLEIREAQLGPDHPDTAGSLNNLAGLYASMGRYSEAEPLYARSLEIREAQLGPEHPSTAQSLNNLALLYDSMGRYSEAEPLYVRSLEIVETQLGAEHPDTATGLNNLAEFYRLMGRYSEAEPLYMRSLKIDESQLGAEHPNTARDLNNLAALYESMGCYSEAEPLYVRAIKIFKNALPPEHPNIETVTNNFRRLLKQVIEAGKTDDLSDHPLTQKMLKELQKESGDASTG